MRCGLWLVNVKSCISPKTAVSDALRSLTGQHTFRVSSNAITDAGRVALDQSLSYFTTLSLPK
jgi:hypothetical protein